MKKGFTLVELIAVIIVLGVISLIAFPIVSGSIKDSKEKAYNSQLNMIKEAAHKWAIDNSNLLSEAYPAYVSVNTLITSGYITKTDSGKLQNPMVDGTYLEGCVSITYNLTYNQYIYEYGTICN